MNLARLTRWKPLILILLVWIVYWNSLHNPFMFDDRHVIPENPSIRALHNIPSFFTDLSHFSILVGNRDYRPVFLTSMALCWWAGGGTVLPFHIVSIALHAANVLLLFLLCRRLFSRRSDPAHGLTATNVDWAALCSAALFALHPLASESVNYLSSQSVPLAACFYLTGFYLFHTVYGGESPPAPTRQWRLWCSYLAYALALFSKPIAITLPIMLIVWDLLFGKESLAKTGSWMQWLRSKGRKHLPYISLSVIYVVIREAVFTQPFGGTQEIRSTYVHYATETKALVLYYLKRAFVPMGLNADLDYPLSASVLEPHVLLAIAVMLGIGGLLLWGRRNLNMVFWSLWFPVCLFLTTYGVILRQVVNEHRVYLSLAGFCALMGFLAFTGWEKFQQWRSENALSVRIAKPMLISALVAVLISFGYQTRERNVVWSSTLTLWEDAALHGGTWRAHMNYALALENAGRPVEALAEFEQAVELGPYAFAYLNLGLAHVKRGNIDEGLSHLRHAVGLWPGSPETRLYLGYGFQQAGQIGEAEAEYREALRLGPDFMKAYRYLADFYEKQARWNDAVTTWQQLLAIDPSQSSVQARIQWLQQDRAAPVSQ
ncbi:MAG TPA: tetratricopeptide repeat protein [Nitrospirales bacterium]|nr:tetratricopeptide repeat protein [Nitrospirales bacterium]